MFYRLIMVLHNSFSIMGQVVVAVVAPIVVAVTTIVTIIQKSKSNPGPPTIPQKRKFPRPRYERSTSPIPLFHSPPPSTPSTPPSSEPESTPPSSEPDIDTPPSTPVTSSSEYSSSSSEEDNTVLPHPIRPINVDRDEIEEMGGPWQIIAHPDDNNLLEYITADDYNKKWHIGICGAQSSGKTSFSHALRLILAWLMLENDIKNIQLSEEYRDNFYRYFQENLKAQLGEDADVPCPENDDRTPTPHHVGNFVVWDLPGVMECESYVKENGLLFMSCIVIARNVSDTDNVDYFIKNCRESCIPFILLQTNMDKLLEQKNKAISIQNLRKRNKETKFDEVSIIQWRREYLNKKHNIHPQREAIMCVKTLPNYEVDDDGIYVDREDHLFELFQCVEYIIEVADAAHYSN